MTSRTGARSRNKKPLETTLGKASSNKNEELIDLSHIRKPIDTNLFALKDVLSLFETATGEVRRYIAYECDIMYECRICRTIYRSLANFILHKRNYCREQYNQNRQFKKKKSVPIEDDNVESSSSSRSDTPTMIGCESNELEADGKKKHLDYVLRRLRGKQESSIITEECLMEEEASTRSSESKNDSENAISLHKITDSSSVVFQTIIPSAVKEQKGDLMENEVMEIHNILENNEAILGADGKIVPSNNEKRLDLMCTVCGQKFSTKRTLVYHVKYKHNNSTMVYRCPECNEIFANTWSVFRHLYKTHRKSTAQVKRMRNQIHSSRTRRDDHSLLVQNENVAAKTTNSQAANQQQLEDMENKQWMADLEGDNDLQRCGGCGRKFERKAALHSHSQFCSKRIAVCNSIKENNAKRVQTEERQSDKTDTKLVIINDNIESSLKGAKRRKLLMAQKMCRVDYEKVNENVEELRPNKDENKNDRAVLTSDKEEELDEINITEDPPLMNGKRSRRDSECSDDVIYVNTIKLSPKEIINNTDIVTISNPEGTNVDLTRSRKYANPAEILTINEESLGNENPNDSESNESASEDKEVVPGRMEEKITLENKSLNYINKDKHICIPCNKIFKSHRLIMQHMAGHFNWYCFQCRSCPFKSYGRSKCQLHIKTQHAIHDEALLENTIITIPNSKTIDMSTDFIELTNKRANTKNCASEECCLNQELKTEEAPTQEELKTVECISTKVPVACSLNEEEQPDSKVGSTPKKDEERRSSSPDMKTIMEVIFGTQGYSGNSESITKNLEKYQLDKLSDSEDFYGFENVAQVDNPKIDSLCRERPIRNRVPVVQKDFLYNMTDILKNVDITKKPKCQKAITKGTKTKVNKVSANLSPNSKHSIINKATVESQLIQDINMNSKHSGGQ